VAVEVTVDMVDVDLEVAMDNKEMVRVNVVRMDLKVVMVVMEVMEGMVDQVLMQVYMHFL